MKKIKYLPLGSVVILNGSVQKLVVIARGMITKVSGDYKFFDYGAAIYPQGLVSEHILYFNEEDIMKIVYEGYTDDDDVLMSDNINKWMSENNYPKGDMKELSKLVKKGNIEGD